MRPKSLAITAATGLPLILALLMQAVAPTANAAAVHTPGDIYAVAGTGTAGYSGSGVLATKSELDYPYGIAVDHAGNLVVADYSNNRVQVIAESTGAYYGRPMTAGHIYKIGRAHV